MEDELEEWQVCDVEDSGDQEKQEVYKKVVRRVERKDLPQRRGSKGCQH